MASSAASNETNAKTTTVSCTEVEEEKDICRICHCTATIEDPLRYPCACRGSIKFVHQDCLLQWLNHSGTRHCEVCSRAFSFTLMYDEKAPARLSLSEQLSWIAAKTWPDGLWFLTCLTIVTFVWFMMVPLVTTEIRNVAFIKSSNELGVFHWLLNYTIVHEILSNQWIAFMLIGAGYFICFPIIEADEAFHEIIGVIEIGVHVIPQYFKELCLSNIVEILSSCMSFALRIIKKGFVITVVLGAFPCVCGWWLHICTKNLVQLQLEDIDLRLLMFFPWLRMLAWWAYGIYSLVVIRKFLLVTSEELREGLLNFLQIPTDIINQNWIREFTAASLHETASRVLRYAGVFMIMTVVLVYLPCKLVMHTIPSFFPLNLIFFISYSEVFWESLGILLHSHYVTGRYGPLSAFKFLLHHWLSFVSGALGLDDFLLPKNEDANAPASRINFEKECQDHQVNLEFAVVLKFAALLILGTVSLVLLTTMMVVPISLGRAVFSLTLWIPTFSSMERNDKISFLVGWIIISVGIMVVRSVIVSVKTRRVLSDVQLVGKWCIISLKSFALISISVLICPLLAGLLFYLTIQMPLDVIINFRMDERPLFYFIYIWVIGCGLLGVCISQIIFGPGRMDADWHAKLARLVADGFSDLRALWVLREILWPLLSFLLNWLCIPYVFASVFPLLGYSMRANSTIFSLAWFGYAVLVILYWSLVKVLPIWLNSLHDHIRDDRYLIGRTLRNYEYDGY